MVIYIYFILNLINIKLMLNIKNGFIIFLWYVDSLKIKIFLFDFYKINIIWFKN